MGDERTAPARWEIRPGAEVRATDGPAGEVLHVVVSPRERRVTHLVVRTFDKREILLPVARVLDITESSVWVDLTRDQLDALETWTPEDYAPAALSWPGWRRLLHGGALLSLPKRLRDDASLAPQIAGEAEARPDESHTVIRRGQHVLCSDGPIGRVDLVLADASTGRVRHVVVRRGRLFSRDVAVPADWIHTITPDAVILEASRDAIAQLPVYRPDDELARDVEDALGHEELLRALDTPIRVRVRDGVVHIYGHVHNRALLSRVEELVRAVPGVMGVENHLVVDLELLQEVTAALQRDPRTRHLVGYQVRVRNGIVELEGVVGSIDAVQGLEEAIASIPHVRGITNHLGGPPLPEWWRRVLQPSIGQPVFATDSEVGRVQFVVINPRTRRVEGLVVEPLPSAHSAHAAVVVPAEVVDRVTPGGVFLRVSSTRVAACPPFDSSAYPPPPAGWIPPFPYDIDDVRVPPPSSS